MKPVVGIFASKGDAERAIGDLKSTARVRDEALNVLYPEKDPGQARELPKTHAEQPGVGKALGGVVGAALGTAGGLHVGTAVASIMVPGVGPVLAAGLAGAALLGTGGAVGGAAVGDALEDATTEGLPPDELFVYEDALRQCRTVVAVFADDDDQAETIRGVMHRTGAESVDAARESWWVGLRTAESEKYETTGHDFRRDELDYRCGFEAALHPDHRGKAYNEALPSLQKRFPRRCAEEPFRHGYYSGLIYYRALIEEQWEGPEEDRPAA